MEIIKYIATKIPNGKLKIPKNPNTVNVFRTREKAISLLLEHVGDVKYRRCLKYYVGYKLLRAIKPEIAIKLGEKAINLAHEFEDLKIVADLSDGLMFYYGTLNFQKEKFLKYSSISDQANKDLTKLYKIRSIYIRLRSDVSTSIVIQEKDQSVDEIEEIKSGTENIEVLRYCALSLITLSQINQDDDKVIKYSLDYVDELISRGYHKRTNAFLSSSAIGALNSKKFEIAFDSIEKGLQLFKDSPYECNIFLQYETLANFRSGYYTKINFEHPPCNKSFEERWGILEAYHEILSFFTNEESKNFKIRKFLNSSPISFKDKSGNNVNKIIIEFFYLFKRKDYNKLIDKEDSIYRYANAYLKESPRERNFLLLLHAFSKHGFNAAKTKYRSSKYIDNLLGLKPSIEVIPFEILGEFLGIDMSPSE